LLDQRVVYVFGKGGVGKSTIAATLGLAAAEQHGRRVIIAEMNGADAMSTLFGTRPCGYAGARLRGRLHGMTITPAEATEEYLVRMLRFRLLYETVFRNRFIAPLMDGVLGLSDLISIGKVLDLEWLREDGSLGKDSKGDHRWDFVVVDGPATGHGLSMLRSPQAMMDLAKVGPLFQNSRDIHDLVADRSRFTVLLVTLAEDMPVSEALQTMEILEREGDVSVAGIVVNSVPPPLFTEPDEEQRWTAIREAGVLLGGRAARAILDGDRTAGERSRAEAQVARLRRSVDVPVIEVPRLPTRDLGAAEIAQLVPAMTALL
jgi:anion-transporting  ArsA/GET3 family ATPase